MSASNDLGNRSRWGRTRFGRRRRPALAVAVPLGVLLALAVAAAGSQAFTPADPVLGAAILTFALAGPMTALVWALCVDRSTLRGAADRPEESVESTWYDRAAQGAFHDLLIVAGLALAVLTITGTAVTGTVVLLGVLATAAVSVTVRYRIHRQRG